VYRVSVSVYRVSVSVYRVSVSVYRVSVSVYRVSVSVYRVSVSVYRESVSVYRESAYRARPTTPLYFSSAGAAAAHLVLLLDGFGGEALMLELIEHAAAARARAPSAWRRRTARACQRWRHRRTQQQARMLPPPLAHQHAKRAGVDARGKRHAAGAHTGVLG
jgi:hypothetical protein